MEDYDKNNWQGRRKEQIEFSSKVVFYSLVAGVIVVIVGILSKFF
jgi:hypothetical protein